LRIDKIAILTAVLALAVYVRTSSSTLLSAGDSAELTTVAYTLGVAHAPGYPLFTLLGHLVSCVTPGKPAHRIILFTALCGSLAILNIYFVLLLWTGRRGGSYIAGVPGNLFAPYGLLGNPYTVQPSGLAMKVVPRFTPAFDDPDLWRSFEFRKPRRPSGNGKLFCQGDRVSLRAVALQRGLDLQSKRPGGPGRRLRRGGLPFGSVL
jgi:hypothetical protein